MNSENIPNIASRIHRNTARVLAAAAVAVFVSAGTLRYWQGWTYLALQLVAWTATDSYLLRHDRELLRRRLAVVEAGETERVHKVFFALVRPLGLGVLILSGLDRRFGWSAAPFGVALAGCLGVAAGSFVVFTVLRENSHASSVIEVAPGQTVVDTGPYHSVRHPMYSGMLLSAMATPLALGSYVGELLFLPMATLFVVRLLAEEQFLSGALPGYDLYMRRTRRRLIPGVW